MKYYADCEFDGHNGPLLSIALIREDNEAIYIVLEHNVEEAADPWVCENIIHILDDIPSPMPGMAYFVHSDEEVSQLLEKYFRHDNYPVIVTDWPSDIKYMCDAMITGPGEMIETSKHFAFELVRVDAYPTEVKGAIQHNAYWDAQALRVLLRKAS